MRYAIVIEKGNGRDDQGHAVLGVFIAGSRQQRVALAAARPDEFRAVFGFQNPNPMSRPIADRPVGR